MDPQIVVNVLVELGQCEEELTDLRAQVARDRKLARDCRELADEYDDDAVVAKEIGRQADRDFRRHDRDLHAAEALLATKRGQLAGLGDLRQHRALTGEIAALEQKIEELEMAGLEALESAETSDGDATQARRDAQRAGDAAPAADPGAQRRRDGAVEELEEEIARLVGMLPRDVGRHVQRLRQRGDRAVAWVAESTCTGCFAQMPPQQGLAAARGRQMVRCASCARFVVHRPWR